MNQLIASTFDNLGLEVPLFKARDAVMRLRRREVPQGALVRFQGQVVCIDFSKVSSASAEYYKDDDTASTVSSDDSVSSCATGSCVTFAEQLVTDVFERPATTWSEKHVLFYSELEYRQFRRDYCLYKMQSQRNILVKFAEEPVSAVYEYSQDGEKDELFYTEQELQRFLDEFVASLNQRLS